MADTVSATCMVNSCVAGVAAVSISPAETGARDPPFEKSRSLSLMAQRMTMAAWNAAATTLGVA